MSRKMIIMKHGSVKMIESLVLVSLEAWKILRVFFPLPHGNVHNLESLIVLS
jgi:hypothetical protein